MPSEPNLRSGARWLAAGLGLGAAGYLGYVATAFARYGRVKRPAAGEPDLLLDQFIPEYEVVERHRIRVAAPAEITFSAATDLDIEKSAVIPLIFKGRELMLGAEPNRNIRPRLLIDQTKALGWRVLAEIQGREIVMGAVTQPWMPDVVFHGYPPLEFAAFREPGYVKIAWTLRADPNGPAESIARTEARVIATDPVSRAKFRRYWSMFSPGIALIRRVSLGLVKTEAERRVRVARNAVC